MPKFLENRLRAEAVAKGFTGRHADAYVYGTLNNRGYMRGNQETKAGAAAEAKHQRDYGTDRVERPRAMHPSMQRHAQLVSEAHAHLSRAIPRFNALPARQRMMAVQEHVRTRKANGYT